MMVLQASLTNATDSILSGADGIYSVDEPLTTSRNLKYMTFYVLYAFFR